MELEANIAYTYCSMQGLENSKERQRDFSQQTWTGQNHSMMPPNISTDSEDIYAVPEPAIDVPATSNLPQKNPNFRCKLGFLIFTSILSLSLAVLALITVGSLYSAHPTSNQIASLNASVLTTLRANINNTVELQELIAMVEILKNSPEIIGSTAQNPATSCNEIPNSRQPGLYWIQANSTSPLFQLYCDTGNPRSCKSCNGTGGWTRVANIDMTDPTQTCPDGLRLITTPRRTCGRPIDLVGCASTTFPVHGIEYSQVCGRVVGYQLGNTEAFWSYTGAYNGFGPQTTIDGHYVDGISITHGQSPRKHIWTFANAWGEDEPVYKNQVCACTNTNSPFSGVVPPFVGTDYFCDTALRVGQSPRDGMFFPDDPLWDGAGCGATSSCCEFNNPPWFCKQLPQPTTDNVELRLCEQEKSPLHDVPFEIVELYVN